MLRLKDVYTILCYHVLLIHTRADFALLSGISQSSDPRDYCVTYSEQWNIQLPSTPKQYMTLIIPDHDSEQDGCHNFSANVSPPSAVLINNADCSVDVKVRSAQFAGVQLLIISGTLDTKGLTDPPVALVIISEKDAANLDSDYAVAIYLPISSFPFVAIIMLFILVMLTLFAASALSNEPCKFLRNGLLYRNGEAPTIHDLKLSKKQIGFAILVFVIFVVTFLLLLHFFFDIVVYVAIFIYCLLCTRCVYSFCSPFVALVPFTSQWRLPANKWPLLKQRPDPRFFVTILFSMVIVVTWFVLRHASYAWILHDFLGFLFICFAVKQFRSVLTYLWPLAMLMILLFVYDAFFVFITPLFIKNPISIMETIATGIQSGSHERIPFLFEIPRLLHHDSLAVACGLTDTLLLGYADVGLPAMLVSFALHMDKTLHANMRLRVYYIITITGYVIGFLLYIIALMLMKTAQPALLYVVPCTLGPFLVVGRIRGEFHIIWRGEKHKNKPALTPKEASCQDQPENSEYYDVEQTPLIPAEDITS